MSRQILNLNPEDLVEIYGEKHRTLIEDSLAWLSEREKAWGLEYPIARKAFIADLFASIVKGQNTDSNIKPKENQSGKA